MRPGFAAPPPCRMRLMLRHATQPVLQHQGEWWTVDAGGQRYQRWWGEDHFGNGWVRKHGHSTTGEQWDVSEQMDTYYKCALSTIRCRLANLSVTHKLLQMCALSRP